MKNHSDDTGTKVGMRSPRSIFPQQQHVSHLKILIGHHFSRWPPLMVLQYYMTAANDFGILVCMRKPNTI